MSGCNASWKGEDTPRVYPYPGCCLFFHEELSSGNVSWLTSQLTDRPSHPWGTMAYLCSSSITVAGPPGNCTPFRFSRSSTCHRRRRGETGQGWGVLVAIQWMYGHICAKAGNPFRQALSFSGYILGFKQLMCIGGWSCRIFHTGILHESYSARERYRKSARKPQNGAKRSCSTSAAVPSRYQRPTISDQPCGFIGTCTWNPVSQNPSSRPPSCDSCGFCGDCTWYRWLITGKVSPNRAPVHKKVSTKSVRIAKG